MGDRDDPQRPSLCALPSQPGSRDSEPQVKLTIHRNNVTLLTFRRLEELGLFQAAVTWLADYMTPNDLDPPEGPLHRLDLTVDLTD